MLDELMVENLGIIEHAHIEPGVGLVVVTGETGAGKTMLLGALRLLMGATSKRELVGAGASEAVVDGRFMFSDEEVTLRRRVTAEGRSKAYVDGSMVPAKALQERIANRVEVVGQHDHMLLTTRNGARRLVDGSLSVRGIKARADYQAAWEALATTRHKIELLGGGRRELERELEMVRFQAEEIAGAGFGSGEDEDLQTRAGRLRNSEDLAAGFNSALNNLGDEGAATRVEQAAAELNRLSRLDPTLAGLQERLIDVAAALGEIQLELAALADDLEHDPNELEQLENRIQLLGALRRKYGESLDEVLEFGQTAQQRADELERLLGTADDLAAELEVNMAAAGSAAQLLTAERRKSAGKLTKGAMAHLEELGMTAPQVEFRFGEAELGPQGGDQLELLFASDAGLSPGPAAKVASGGELSRLTLALRLAAGLGDADLIAFDEVDAGIGGTTALAMGDKLAALAVDRQIFCVTHLPQVAAYADTHFVVERGSTRAEVRMVTGDDRLTELSRMLGGLPDSERGQLHAAELLAAAART